MASPQDALSRTRTSWNAGGSGWLARLLAGADGQGRRAGLYQGIFSAFDVPKLEFHEVLWDGAAWTIRFTMTGRHVGDFMGSPPPEPRLRCPGLRSCASRGRV
jgi:hypothetical protein